MRMKDFQGKEKDCNQRNAVWTSFVVPEIEHYRAIVADMDKEYAGLCPCCRHPDLVFLADSGIWQASKDKMKPGLPYAHERQIVRWCCTCCNK
jgi:hypothetical protein